MDVAQAIAGSGVEVIAADFTSTSGFPQRGAIGTFSGAPGLLGFSDGVALTTGSLNGMLTISDPGYQSLWSVDLPDLPLDSDYMAANGNALEPATDLVRLTMQIIPAGSVLRVGHLFASEEFGAAQEEPPVSPFNDGALILVESQEPGWPDKNCARLPNDAPVTVEQINAAPVGTYTTDSAGQRSGFYGATAPMECVTAVRPGETVTIRFVAFDRGGGGADGTYDSALVLGRDALTSNAVPVASLAAAPARGAAPLNVVFSTAGSGDPEEGMAGWSLDFGDGAIRTGTGSPPATLAHRYAAAGSYTAELTVEDDTGQERSATAEVSVGPPISAFAIRRFTGSPRGTGIVSAVFPRTGIATMRASARLGAGARSAAATIFARRSVPITRTGLHRFRIRPRGAALRSLLRTRRLPVTVTITFRAAGAAASRTRSVKRTLRLRG